MADIDAYLVEAENGPAPQHKIVGKNKFEASEGSDGAIHSKIVDKHGDPIDPREVKIKTLETKLESLENKLDSVIGDGAVNSEVGNFPSDYPDTNTKTEIVNLQDKINDLETAIKDLKNHTFDTQVTGSIVEQKTFKKTVSVDISPEQTLEIKIYADVGEIWRVLHGHIELYPSVGASEGKKELNINPGKTYMSKYMGPSITDDPKSYMKILSNENEENRYWFGNLLMDENSGFIARVTNNTDGTIEQFFYSLSVEVINDANK